MNNTYNLVKAPIGGAVNTAAPPPRKMHRRINWADRAFRLILPISAIFLLALCAMMLISLWQGSTKAFSTFGILDFVFGKEWNPTTGAEEYGALPFIAGTLLTSLLALIICIPFSLPVALFVGEYFRGTRVAKVLGTLVDLLAGIPSIVYGLWGFYALRPLMISMGFSDQGFGYLTCSLILAVMIIPYASSLSADFIAMTPSDLKEAAYSLGCTRAEVIRKVILPSAGSGIFAAYTLALGRALGETMAVTMLIGNTNLLPTSVTDTGNSMASLIANQFGEADGLKLSSLMAIALLLFVITAVVNGIARLVMRRKKQ